MSSSKYDAGAMTWGKAIVLSLVALVLLRGNGCGPDLIENPGFDLWCGDTLCSWEVEGEIERVPTWHEHDFGVALIGKDVKLSQMANLDETSMPKCFEFDLLVRKDTDAELFIEMDFQDDGTSEYSHPIPSGDWVPVHYKITAPTWYTSVRFIVHKTGIGKAVLARIRIQDGLSCQGPPLELTNRPLGAPCEKDSQCKDGFCTSVNAESDAYLDYGKRCSSCRDTSDCNDGEACFFIYSNDLQAAYCLIAGLKSLGERCLTPEECGTGICCKNVCSSCCEDKDCPEGRFCTKRDVTQMGEEYYFIDPPFQCDPARAEAGPGEPCLFDDDCKSGECDSKNALKLCAFVGASCDSDDQCPEVCLGPGACGEPACLALGRRNGVCK